MLQRTCNRLAMQHLHHAVIAPHCRVLAGQHAEIALRRPCGEQADDKALLGGRASSHVLLKGASGRP